ncbi:MAG: fumarylacetoacetate hydrolase family protein [Burkholderiales bacterium]|nr:fumarylacetoacetate hydrolase family protein [Burkholderiales bacterium]
MKFVTFKSGADERLGILDDGKGVLDLVKAGRAVLGRDLPGDMLSFIAAGEAALADARKVAAAADGWVAAASVKLMAPIPHYRKNVFCVGRNYKLHIEEGARARGVPVSFPPVPEFFSKPPTTVIGHGDDIEWDSRATKQLDYEIELGIVIGRKTKNIAEADALSAVFGYTIVNDVSAREVQRAHGQWFKGKSMDTFAPIGPCIVTADEFGSPSGHQLVLKVNGEVRQDSNTSDMLFNCQQIVASLSTAQTLEPGDTIATGTPSGVALGMEPPAWLKDGDTVELSITGIGTLVNKVRKVA